jgi:hypothetical protein
MSTLKERHSKMEIKKLVSIISLEKDQHALEAIRVAIVKLEKRGQNEETTLPFLVLTPEDSELGRIMKIVDCGETPDIGNPTAAESALARMIREERTYTFSGGEAYTWATAAQKYADLIARI